MNWQSSPSRSRPSAAADCRNNTAWWCVTTWSWAPTRSTTDQLDKVRWLEPVYAGDTIRAVIQVAEARPSKSDPGRGVLVFRYDTYNQNDEKVMTYRAPSLIRRRPTG